MEDTISNIQNREYHEVFNFINPPLTKSFQLGNSLKDRIPYNQVQELEELNKLEKSNTLDYDEYCDLLPKLNFNIGDTNMKFISQTLIKQKNYFDMYELLLRTPPFNTLPPLQLYTYCRNICNKPISEKEFNKINADMNILKKNTEKYEIMKPKFKNIKSEIKF